MRLVVVLVVALAHFDALAVDDLVRNDVDDSGRQCRPEDIDVLLIDARRSVAHALGLAAPLADERADVGCAKHQQDRRNPLHHANLLHLGTNREPLCGAYAARMEPRSKGARVGEPVNTERPARWPAASIVTAPRPRAWHHPLASEHEFRACG